jgi:hypothetical protein
MVTMLSKPITDFLGRMEEAENLEPPARERESAIEVNAAIAMAATFYEKLRYLVDYRDEHTIRRNAIERVLKRRVFIERRAVGGEALLQELVDGHYLLKHEATDELTQAIDASIRKFIDLQTLADADSATVRSLLSFAATEIESHLSAFQYTLDESIADAFQETMRGRVLVAQAREGQIDEQLYCAIWRSLFAADNERLAYALWLMCTPSWRKPDPDMRALAAELPGTMRRIRTAAGDPLQWQIASKIRNESIYFGVIREIARERRGQAALVLGDKKKLDEFTSEFLARTYEVENKRIRGSGMRAVAYLCITKIIVAFIFEVPYDIIVSGAINYTPLLINVIFPPALLFALTRRVGSLGEKNTGAVLRGVHRILYPDLAAAPRPIRIGTRYPRMAVAFDIVYVFLVLAVFAGLVGILAAADFNPVSITLFLFFLALVSYFALRIRSRGSRWRVIENQSTLAVLASVFTIPVVNTGRWLSRTFSSINVFVLILDFIIETPFKRLLHFFNQFIFYLRDKAEDMR